MKNCTVLFLTRNSNQGIKEVCLAMKKRGFGQGRWNGVGGKVMEGETIESTAIREALEEINVEIKNLKKVGEINFSFPHNELWNQKVHVFLTDEWEGDPQESEEMDPKWFSISDIPFDKMWAADKYWIPNIIEGKLIQGNIVFGENDTVLECSIKDINNFF